MTTDMEMNGYESFMSEKSLSAPTTPTESNKSLQSRKSRCKGRRVNFPNDDMIVTRYFDPPDPWRKVSEAKSDSVLEAYEVGCEKQGIKPLPCIAQQLQGIKAFSNREQSFSVKGENLDFKHCEALEEVFKRVQFQNVSLEECHLDDEGAAALFDMIEYYESANYLTLSLLKNIDCRSWQACSRMLKKTPSLQHLSTRNTGLTEQCLLTLGRALRLGSNLVTLHMENCGLSGKLLVILVAALKLNTSLKELYLGENQMMSSDGNQLGNLVKTNSYLELLDLSNNNLQDEGLECITSGLSEQQSHLERGLKCLILCNNKLTHKGMEYISSLLISTKSLQRLCLDNNEVTNEGIHSMKPGLLCNYTLESLQLRNMGVTCEGAVALAEYIADNKRIRKLNLKENDIKAAGLMALALSMKHNCSITNLELDAVITKDTDGFDDHRWLLKEIAEYCERNKTEKIPKEETITSLNNKVFHLTPVLSNQLQSPIRNRFQVSRVYLEKDPEKSATGTNIVNKIKQENHIADTIVTEESIPIISDTKIMEDISKRDVIFKPTSISQINCTDSELSTSPNEHNSNNNNSSTNNNNNKNTWNEDQSIQTPINQDIIGELPNTSELIIDGCIDESDIDDEIFIDNAKYPNDYTKNNRFDQEEQDGTRVTFNVPDILDSSNDLKKERRMSTPIDSQQKIQICNLKLCKQLDCLDLKSSVPLSPTRLMEGWIKELQYV